MTIPYCVDGFPEALLLQRTLAKKGLEGEFHKKLFSQKHPLLGEDALGGSYAKDYQSALIFQKD